MTQLSLPSGVSLSVTGITASARDLPDRFNNFGRALYDIILPAVTLEHIREHANDTFLDFYTAHAEGHEVPETENPNENERCQERFIDRLVEDEDLFKLLVEDFKPSRGYGEWRDAFAPVQDFFWPVEPAHRIDIQDAANLIDEFAPSCTLIKFAEGDDDVYGIALSGGFMDLSDQIAIAYLCCGVVPPLALLTSLRGVISASALAEVSDVLKAAYQRASSYLKGEVERLDDTAAILFEQEPEPA